MAIPRLVTFDRVTPPSRRDAVAGRSRVGVVSAWEDPDAPRSAVPEELRPFSCAVERRVDAVVVRAEGELDLASVALFQSRLDSVVAERPEAVLLDLRGLTFVDSSGLRAILGLRRSLEPTCGLRIVRGSPSVQRIFDIAGVGSMLPFVDADSC